MAVKVLTVGIERQSVITSNDLYDAENIKLQKIETDMNYRHKLVPKLVIIFAVLHASSIYALYLILTNKIMLLTTLWAVFVAILSSQGIMLGAHRGFSHNAYKITIPAQIMLIIFQTISGQNHIYWWARDHRLHHKYCDTDADPYNASRGFFFSHIGWLISRKHPMVAEKGKTIDMSDLKANKLIMFQRRYFPPMFLLFCVIIPTLVPVYTWNESLWNSFFISFVLRYIVVLNMTWCINSIAHLYGTRDFDKRISARQSYFGNTISLGEGWHNYHHSFPWDHAFSEFGCSRGFSTNCLYLLHKIGLVYDLKKASRNVVYNHSLRHGDGTLGTERSQLIEVKKTC